MEHRQWRRNTALILLAILGLNFLIAFGGTVKNRLFPHPSLSSGTPPKSERTPTSENKPESERTRDVSGAWKLERLFPGTVLRGPTDLQNAGDDRLFITEQPGRILVISSRAQNEKAKVFLDITKRVKSGGERGLLGLAFHPSFKTNSQFFVHYSAEPSGDTVISRFRLRAGSSEEGDANSEEILLRQAQPFSNHNGGTIAFGPDGYLYISLGDGGSGGDPQGNGQNPQTLLGKILRIDIDTASESVPYGIPADNPFAAGANGARPEIFALGLRNAWKMSFDVHDGALWAADVGQNAWEEIDIIEKGKNYGWNIMEGTHCFLPKEGCVQENLELPILDYSRSEGQSVTGGYVYRGKRLPELVGKYIFADFVTGRIWALERKSGETLKELLIPGGRLISSFGTDSDGELYVLSYADGGIYRLSKNL